MKKEKVLYVHEYPMLTSLSYLLQEFTVHNGTYPDYIDMGDECFKRYKNLFTFKIGDGDYKYRGIPIRCVEY